MCGKEREGEEGSTSQRLERRAQSGTKRATIGGRRTWRSGRAMNEETMVQEGWKEYPERERRDPHPTDSYNFNHQLATPPASDRGRVICEKHVDLREEEGREDSFISSYISWKRSARTFVNVAGVSGTEEQVETSLSLGILGRPV